MKYYTLREIVNDFEINESLLSLSMLLGKEQGVGNIKINNYIKLKEEFSEVHSSNTIEGIAVDNAKEVFSKKDGNFKKNEKEWIGIKIAFNYIKENHSDFFLTVGNILKLHSILLNNSKNEIAGKFKINEVFINQYKDGIFVKAISTSLPENTHDDLETAIARYNENIQTYPQYKVIAILLFIGEFLAIHPFSDGNGRLSRLISIWLYARNNIKTPLKISLSKFINETRGEYYSVLDFASEGLINNRYDAGFIKPWILYNLSILHNAYKQIDKLWESNNENKDKQIEDIIFTFKTPFVRKDILTKITNVDPTYVSKILNKLVNEGRIERVGDRKGTSYKVLNIN